MRTITFYSYKGGVGRTLACANFGLYLAKAGQKVVMADLDLEAPGLDSKFFGDGVTRISSGLLDQIAAFQAGAELPNLSPIPLNEVLSEEVMRSGGRLQLLPAGDHSAPEKYYQLLSSLDWQYLTDEGLAFWLDLERRISEELAPDVLLIDSRTGMTEIAGICTQVLADTVVMFSSTSPESLNQTRRMYHRIKKSRISREVRANKSDVDVRVVITRIPRPKDLQELDHEMQVRLDLEVPKLYYLFADDRLAMSEYLAMGESNSAESAVRADYVELFANLNPEDTAEYIKRRLEAFRASLTLRAVDESRREIRELVGLFPRKEVYLEAARYFRLTKESEESISNYLRYLQEAPNHVAIILELAEVSLTVPVVTLAGAKESRDAIVRHLWTLGPQRMDAPILAMFGNLTRATEHLQAIAASIEGDAAKLANQAFRPILFRALHEIKAWERIVASITDIDLKDSVTQRILAVAYSHRQMPEKALQIIHRMAVRDPSEIVSIVELLYQLRGSASHEEIRKVIEGNRNLRPYLSRHAIGLWNHPSASFRDDAEFRSWLLDLVSERKQG